MTEEQKKMHVRRKEKKPSRTRLWLVLTFSAIVCLGLAAVIVVYAQKRVTRPDGKNVTIRVPAATCSRR